MRRILRLLCNNIVWACLLFGYAVTSAIHAACTGNQWEGAASIWVFNIVLCRISLEFKDRENKFLMMQLDRLLED